MRAPVVITGGGTGGHVFAMQAIAEALVERGVVPGDLRYVASARGLESTLLAGTAVPLTLLSGRGVRRSLRPRDVGANVAAVAGLGVAFVRAWWLVKRWRPAVVVSVGGYASFPASLAAVLTRRPLVLVELDAVAGAAQRVLARHASARCVAFDDGSTAVVTGAPVRDAVTRVERSSAAVAALRRVQQPPIDEGRAVVVVMTGSLGSARVNCAVVGLAGLWASRRDRTLIHVTGRRDYASVLAARPPGDGLDYRVVDFADMALLWGLCDVAVCRAGATTVAELAAVGVGAVLVPLPGAPGDHQTKNAAALAEAGAAVIVDDADCSPEVLARRLDELLVDGRAVEMGGAARALGRADAAAAIAGVVMDVAGRA